MVQFFRNNRGTKEPIATEVPNHYEKLIALGELNGVTDDFGMGERIETIRLIANRRIEALERLNSGQYGIPQNESEILALEAIQKLGSVLDQLVLKAADLGIKEMDLTRFASRYFDISFSLSKDSYFQYRADIAPNWKVKKIFGVPVGKQATYDGLTRENMITPEVIPI